MEPNPKKVEAVSNYPISKNPKKVKQFLGLVSYYRRYIHNFAQKAKPFFDLLKKETEFIWGPDQQKAFEELKIALCTEPVLIAPDFKKPFLIVTDASDFAVGAILCQEKLEKEQVIAYASRVLKAAELKYSTYEKELLAVVFATEQFRPYIYGRPFQVITDNQALKWLHDTKKPDLRAHRLKSKLEGYEFEIIYRPGKTNVNADALSRNPVIGENEEDPELPRKEIYDLADKQIKENYELQENFSSDTEKEIKKG